MKAVLCRELRHTFGTTVAVDGIDLAVEEGEIFGLLGPSGAGKTTAIRLITTLLPAAPGMVEVFGRDVAANRMAVRRTIGYLPQQLSADSALTALITGKAFAAGVRALARAVAILVLSVILGVTLTLNPLRWLGVLAVVMIGTAFFASLSMTIAGLAMSRDRLMGIGPCAIS